MTPEAERFNGWAAMLGFVAAVGVTTGQIILLVLSLKKEFVIVVNLNIKYLNTLFNKRFNYSK